MGNADKLEFLLLSGKNKGREATRVGLRKVWQFLMIMISCP